MPSQPSKCPECGEQGRWGWDDDWFHDSWDAALNCPREGFSPDTAYATNRPKEG